MKEGKRKREKERKIKQTSKKEKWVEFPILSLLATSMWEIFLLNPLLHTNAHPFPVQQLTIHYLNTLPYLLRYYQTQEGALFILIFSYIKVYTLIFCYIKVCTAAYRDPRPPYMLKSWPRSSTWSLCGSPHIQSINPTTYHGTCCQPMKKIACHTANEKTDFCKFFYKHKHII